MCRCLRLRTLVIPLPTNDKIIDSAKPWLAPLKRAPCTWWRRCACLLFALVIVPLLASRAAAEVQFAQANPEAPLTISATHAERIPHGPADIWVLDGNCVIQQGNVHTRSRQAVVWVEQQVGAVGYRVTAYLDQDVILERRSQQPGLARQPVQRLADHKWMGHFMSRAAPKINVGNVVVNAGHDSELMRRAYRARHGRSASPVQPVQFSEEVPAGVPAATSGTRRIRAFPRSDVRIQAEWFQKDDSEEWVAVVTNGVQIVIEGAADLGVVDISTDRLVIWTRGLQQPNLSGQTDQSSETPLEFYMEGNIEFRQGERVIYASSMYYDVRNNVGIVLNAEMLTPMEQHAGKVRIAASEIRQLSQDQFLATGARLTTSRMGEPSYWVEAGNVQFQDRQTPLLDPFTGQPVIDPLTNQPAITHDREITAAENFIYLSGVPVFYWPRVTTDLNDGALYLRDLRVGGDGVFGTQILTQWDMYDLLGIKPLAGTDWYLDADYMSDRGPGGGMAFKYDRPGFFGIAGPTKGEMDVWGIYDTGRDNLGLGRRSLIPEQEFRGRVFWQHRQHLWNGFQVTGQVGYLSDRNFLEQYFEEDWDTEKDQNTGLQIKRIEENRSWSVAADVPLNDFYTETGWLPRGDHYWLGESLLFDRVTWYEHTSAGYGQFRTADAPTDPTELPTFTRQPWEMTDQDGERLVTTHLLEAPFSLGAVKMVPYVLGQFGHWGSDINGDDIQRAYGQVGVKSSLAMWCVDPMAESRLLNVHGLAHKVVFDAELAFGESNRDVDQFPLYDPLDDNAIEAFRRRYSSLTFGGAIPPMFDERYYAIRSGQAGWVTSPATEVVDDLAVLRLGARQRWQTKRGMPGARRIVDYVVFDTNVSFFPKEDRDNFGEVVGLADYDFRWHLGDRFTLLSDGIFDLFSDGQRLVTFGGLLNRPDRGSLYLGLRSLEGPINSQVVLASLSYRMSDKWIASMGSAVDLGDEGNLGQNMTITRLGESFLVRVGFNADIGKDSIGAKISIEPRFWRSGRGRPIDGILVPPAGAHGLE